MGIYVCIWLIHFVIQQKHNTVKQLYSNKDVKKRKKPSHKENSLCGFTREFCQAFNLPQILSDFLGLYDFRNYNTL